MKTIKFIALTGCAILLSAFTINESVNWKIADDYSIKFSGTKAEGLFKKMEGAIQFDEANVSESSLSFTIDVNSINTGNGLKNRHAVGKNWFEAKLHPTISFTSKSVSKTATGYQVTGAMTVHGITKEMTIPFTFINNTFNSKFSVNRMDFGVGTMKGMSKKVSNEIKLDVTIPVSK